jgi:hypothetical protein
MIRSILWLLLVLLVWSCNEGPTEANRTYQRLGLGIDRFEKVVVSDTAIIVSGGVFGVYEQKPSYTGPWTLSGLSFPERQFGDFQGGVRCAIPLSVGGLLAGIHPAVTDTAIVYARPGPNGWLPRSMGLPRVIVYDLIESASGRFVSMTSSGVYVSVDTGISWDLSFRVSSALGGTLYRSDRGVYVGGQTLNETPFLIFTLDEGATWTGVDVSGIAGKGIVSIATATGAQDSLLLVATEQQLFRRRGTEPFVAIHGSGPCGFVSVNPDDPKTVAFLADSVAVSDDQGDTWSTTALPGRAYGRGTVDWERSTIVVPILESDGGMLYSLDLPGDGP